MATYTLKYIADYIGAELLGVSDANTTAISGLAPVATATASEVCFVSKAQYALDAMTCKAGAVICAAAIDGCSRPLLISSNPYLAYAKATALFDLPYTRATGCHATASIDPTAILGDGVSIGAHAVVEAGVQLGNHCHVGAGCYIGAGSSVGAGSQLQPNVTILQQCSIGEYVRIHSGAVIGAEGFGFAPDVANPNPRCKWQRIAQLGRVLIGDYVRIGAGTTIDRGALDNTVIGHGVILDNQIQIAHNVQIGDFTAIAAQTGIAGSSTIGKRCMIAGGVGIAGHLTIGDDISITAASVITKSISVAGSYSSGMAFSDTVHWRKTAVAVRQLPDELPKLKAQLAALQQQVNQLAQALAAATNPSDTD